MRSILPGRLWLGNAADARNPTAVIQAGILAVVDLAAEEPVPAVPRSLIYCHFPLSDGQQDSPQVLRVALQTLVSLLRAGVPTLVCCGTGMSRSPAIAAAAFAIVEGGSAEDRLRQIVSGHPHDVSSRLWRDIQDVLAAWD